MSYAENIKILKRLECQVGKEGTIGPNEAILCGEIRTLMELEKQYAERLGRMAQLCDTICPFLLNIDPATGFDAPLPAEVRAAAEEIMSYVEAVRP